MGALQYQCNYKRKYPEWCHHYTVFEKTSASRALQTKLRLFQVLVTSVDPSLGGRELDSPGHQRKSLKCLWQMLHIRWNQDVTNAYFVTHQCFSLSSRGAVGRKIRAEQRPQGVPQWGPLFPRRYHVCIPNASVSILVPGVHHFVLGLHYLCLKVWNKFRVVDWRWSVKFLKFLFTIFRYCKCVLHLYSGCYSLHYRLIQDFAEVVRNSQTVGNVAYVKFSDYI